MRIKHKVNVRIGEDDSMDNILFGPADNLAEITLDTFDRCYSGVFSVAESVSELLSLGDIDDVRGLYLKVDGSCTLFLNESNDGLALSGGTGGIKFFMEGAISQIKIEAGGTAVTGLYCIWGL